MKKLLFYWAIALAALLTFGAPAAAQTAAGQPNGTWSAAAPSTSGDGDTDPQAWQEMFSSTQSCWGCKLFTKMATVTLDVGKQGSELFTRHAINAMNAFMGLWVVYQLYLLLSITHANSPGQTLDTIFQRIVLMMIILFILKQEPFGYIMQGYVFPTIGGIMASANALIGSVASVGGDCGVSGGTALAGAESLVRNGNSLMCSMHQSMGKGIGLGAWLMASAEFDLSLTGSKFEIFQFAGGLIVFLAFGLMLILLPFRLFDAMIRLAIVSVILPVVVFAYQFKPTRGVVKQAVTSTVASGLTFLFTAVAVAISVLLIDSVAKDVFASMTSNSDADVVVGPLGAEEFMILVAAALGMAAFIMQAGSIASEFAGFQGSMGNIGNAGAAATSKSVGNVAGKAGTMAGQAAVGAPAVAAKTMQNMQNMSSQVRAGGAETSPHR